ncbi:uncharacterized protein LOC124885903 [Capsicum annuum]|uniref:uncharacterized protein LOC124885903 n=1 Tax=Capsicum annuum TaxID=4072 RepID=UPI001FB19B10|nr:uncharacterized protein LOC124885903 [Capsicum annuum]
MASAVAELTWLEGLFAELNVPMSKPITLFSDSKSAIQLAADPIFHERTKHIEIDCHFFRDKIKSGLVHTRYIPTHLQKTIVDFGNASKTELDIPTKFDYLLILIRCLSFSDLFVDENVSLKIHFPILAFSYSGTTCRHPSQCLSSTTINLFSLAKDRYVVIKLTDSYKLQVLMSFVLGDTINTGLKNKRIDCNKRDSSLLGFQDESRARGRQ